ncbi:MAG: hypothetical protein JNK02_08150 [Planctomycetes bacterium]|nr:hypothetical protein [Planctomycetota bacterium]
MITTWLPWAACVPLFLALPLGSAVQQDAGPLQAIAARLRAGDASAIDELLSRTQPASHGPAAADARLERLRAEVELLRARRAARPVLFPLTVTPTAVEGSGLETTGAARVDGVREARAWLRAGSPARALAAAEASGGEALHLEARALEQLGRRGEAIEAWKRAAATSPSPLVRSQAAAEARHLEWLEKRRAAQAGRP